jgi:hypothetical protein
MFIGEIQLLGKIGWLEKYFYGKGAILSIFQVNKNFEEPQNNHIKASNLCVREREE